MDSLYPHRTVQGRVRPEIIYAWNGPSLGVLDTSGAISGENLTGYYFHGTRFLSRMMLMIADELPHVCSIGSCDTANIEFSLIYPEVSAGGTGGSGSGMINRHNGLYERCISAFATMRVRPAGLDIELTVENAWERQANFFVSWLLDADFMSLDAVKNKRPVSSTVTAETSAEALILHNADPQFPLQTKIQLSGGLRCRIQKDRVSAEVDLARGEQTQLTLRVHAFDPVEPMDEEQQRLRESRVVRWRECRATLESSGEHPFVQICNDSIELVGLCAGLSGTSDEWLAPVAGYPLYPYLFGRDALTSSWMVALFDNGQALDHTLTRLGRLQGTTQDAFRDEQPGRIIQQARMDLDTRMGTMPFDRYYGDYAAPLMYIISLAFLYACTGDLGSVRRHWQTARRALWWAEHDGDIDGDGYLEYQTRSEFGPRNQGWKDSENAVVYNDGSLVAPPIATCELQGYYYAALQTAAGFSLLFGERKESWRLFKKAATLKKKFNRDFWVADGGYIGFGLDSRKCLIRGRTSNMGHCLATGIVDKRKIGGVVEALFAQDMYSGWGIRTLSAAHPAYNPLSYHLGSVWPVENATIAMGLRRYGFTQRALQLVESNYRLCNHWHRAWAPECVGGYDRGHHAHEGAYPQANAPQVWNAASWGLHVQVLLGLQPVAPLRTLCVDPVLPEWLPHLRLRNLKIGGARVSIDFCRTSSGKTRFKVIEKSGTLRVLRQPPVNSLSTSVWARLADLGKGAFWG